MQHSTTQLINMRSGVKTKSWGPHFWHTMYFVAMNYPLNPSQQDRRHYKTFYTSLQHLLPCGWCIESYRRFIIESPIDDFLDSRMRLLRWVWIIHDKVNKKLIACESNTFAEERKRLTKQWSDGKLTKSQLGQRLDKARDRICVTQKSTPFREVLDEYAQHRAIPK